MTKALAKINGGMEQWALQKEQAKLLLESGFLPTWIKKPAQALAVIQVGQELGIGPMQAFSDVNLVNGKPGLSARLMLGLCYRDIPGFQFDVVESTQTRAEVRMRRGTQAPWVARSFSWDDAKTAGLTGKQVWKQYAEDMLLARAITRCVRLVGADAVRGMTYTPEELGADSYDGETGEVLTPQPAEYATTVTVVADPAEPSATTFVPTPFPAATAADMLQRISEIKHPVEGKNWKAKHRSEILSLGEDDRTAVIRAWQKRMAALMADEQPPDPEPDGGGE
jgi:hypothetical protein